MAAIYQWFVDGELILTTTLYPIEEKEGLKFSADIDTGILVDPGIDAYTYDQEFIGGSITQVLLTAPVQTDAYTYDQEFISGSITQILLEAPEQTDAYTYDQEFISGQLVDILITAYSPDHGLIMTVDIDTATLS